MIQVSKGADWITKPSVKPFRICQRAAYLLSTSYWRICFSAARLAASAWLTLGAIASRPRPSSASPARIPVGANAQQKVHASVPTFRSDLSDRSEKPTRSKQTEIEIYRANRACEQAGPARSRCGLFFHLISAQVVHGNLERLRQVLRILRLVLVVQVQEIHRQTFHASELQRRILSVPPQQFLVR